MAIIKTSYKRLFVAGFAIATVVSLFFGYIAGIAASVVYAALNVWQKRTGDSTKDKAAAFFSTTGGAIAAIGL